MEQGPRLVWRGGAKPRDGTGGGRSAGRSAAVRGRTDLTSTATCASDGDGIVVDGEVLKVVAGVVRIATDADGIRWADGEPADR